ncbi:site-specific integrase [Arachidicoccus terrestris]|uniref:site-specific integrase n=1 Tax=Arachidicoccus terrestris TaxID=2875539 RepID=UPI001CC51D7A|nr:site-specific integrase [Arachidicoccus terrestris]UAY55451.1 site-specific integrase [Arachidicoccus terrestris]
MGSLQKKGILAYMLSKDLIDYDENVGNEFMLTCHDGSNVTFHHRDLIKSIDVLSNVLQNNKLGGRMHCLVQYRLRGEIGDAANQYFESLKARCLNSKTLHGYKKRISNFVEYLFEIGIDNVPGITEEAIVKYIEDRQHQQAEYIGHIRRFLSFLFSETIIPKDYSYLLKSIGNSIKRVKAPSFYTPNEVKRIEQSISRSDNVGKRNYAMVLLCSRLGLRVSDVANLGLNNISWDDNAINIVQYKTGNPLTLPLLPIVGNAIIDYLRYARPKSQSINVFLSCRPPYRELNGAAIHGAIHAIFKSSGIELDGRHHGGHALRFSLAQRMLDKSTPIPIISETLGHTEIDTTSTYVKIDLLHIMGCVLGVPVVARNFYTQRGGWFYD